MIPTPIRQVLSMMQKHGVRALLMGGQACVFYGAAQVSKDVDFVVFADADNFERLLRAFEELNAGRIAVPRFDPELLARGHAVHFRCQAAGVSRKYLATVDAQLPTSNPNDDPDHPAAPGKGQDKKGEKRPKK